MGASRIHGACQFATPFLAPCLQLWLIAPQLGGLKEIDMSYLSRRVGSLVLALLTVFMFVPSAGAQVNAVKDGWLAMKIHSEFVDEDVLSGSNIDVDVKNGMVTLQGTVPSEAARARAIAAAKANDGVKGVTDQLRIAPACTQRQSTDKARRPTRPATRWPRPPTRLKTRWTRPATRRRARRRRPAARSTTAGSSRRSTRSTWPTGTPCSTTATSTSMSTNNMVALNGTVKTAAAKTKAVAIAKATDGVKGVKDNLKVVAGTR